VDEGPAERVHCVLAGDNAIQLLAGERREH
jgi:hypothetical protein